jgi:hypothetical protein
VKYGCTILIAATALLAPVVARAWDGAGHMIVDQIAWEQMTPAARTRAAELVKSLDARFNDRRPYHFVTAGSWMDDMRGMGRDYPWSKLHYVNIPWTPTGSPVAVPPGPHVISAIGESLKTLRDSASSGPQRTEALAMLMHFVGDIHQPLHVTERNRDRGGNTYLISGVPFSDLGPKQLQNLHTFWDKAFRFDGVNGGIVETWAAPSVNGRPRAPGEGVIAVEARRMMTDFPPASLPELAGPVDALVWATESYEIGCKQAYPPGEPPPNTEVRPLTPEFVHASQQIARRRLALAGYRLGALLNELLGK